MRLKIFSKYCIIVFMLFRATLLPSAGKPDLNESDIEMSWETVEIFRMKNRVHVKVTYSFSGIFDKDMQLAFPETEWFKMENFKMFFNSKPLEVIRKEAPAGSFYRIPGAIYPAILITIVPGASSKKNVIINEYDYTSPEFKPGSKSEYEMPKGRYIEYILKTGAGWKGTIGSIDVLFNSNAKCSQILEFPDGYHGSCKNGNWKFHGENINPDRDVRLLILD